jgi:hypothetical protein
MVMRLSQNRAGADNDVRPGHGLGTDRAAQLVVSLTAEGGLEPAAEGL